MRVAGRDPGPLGAAGVGLTFVAGALSALLVNDTVCIVLTPLVVRVAIEARLPPLPYLLALASATNLGGVVAFSGNPQNMIVGAAAADTRLRRLPRGVGAAWRPVLAANAATLSWLFRAELPTGLLDDRDAPPARLRSRARDQGPDRAGLFAGLAAAGVALRPAPRCSPRSR